MREDADLTELCLTYYPDPIKFLTPHLSNGSDGTYIADRLLWT